MKVFVKDPESVLDYKIDWSDWLADDELVGVPEWSVDAGLDIILQTHDFKSSTVWVAGGEFGKRYRAVNKIQTKFGRIDERTIFFDVRDK